MVNKGLLNRRRVFGITNKETKSCRYHRTIHTGSAKCSKWIINKHQALANIYGYPIWNQKKEKKHASHTVA